MPPRCSTRLRREVPLIRDDLKRQLATRGRRVYRASQLLLLTTRGADEREGPVAGDLVYGFVDALMLIEPHAPAEPLA